MFELVSTKYILKVVFCTKGNLELKEVAQYYGTSLLDQAFAYLGITG